MTQQVKNALTGAIIQNDLFSHHVINQMEQKLFFKEYSLLNEK